MGTFTTEWAKIRENQSAIATLSKSSFKIDKLAAHLLAGNPITGRTMIEQFNIYSYRDAIYALGQKGYKVSNKVVIDTKGIEHRVWWLTEFSEEFVKSRKPEMFR